VLPDLINRNLDRGCARTSDFSPLEKRAWHVRRTYQAERDPLPSPHFSSFSARLASLFSSHPSYVRRPFSPPLSRFLLSCLRHRVLSYYVFNAQTNVIVTSRRPCAKRAPTDTELAYTGWHAWFYRARCNSEIYCGVCFCGRIARSAGQYGKYKER